MSTYSEAIISHNTWVHRSVRWAVRPLVDTRVVPNHLTTLRLLTGLGAATAFATGEMAWQIAGAAILVVSLCHDRADGELARLSGKMSKGGHIYDLISDGVSNAAVFIGIGIGLSLSGSSGWMIVLGFIFGVLVAVAEILVMRLDSTGVRSSADLGGKWGFDPDDGMFVVPIAMAFGWAEPLLIVAAIGASAAVAVFAIWWIRRRVTPTAS
ncbi:MAG: CDP-alcohol phosphatidyltransferase [Rhodospirillaceae bacterium]|nr:CDP-alcohol phosphatidyltransferase [Rhodospirillaceae bacterium]